MAWPWSRQARDKPAGKNGRRARNEARTGGTRERRGLDLRFINRPRADRTVEGNEAIYAAVSRISNTIASMPVHLYKDYKIAESHPLERLISLRPHPNFTAFGWKQTMEVLRNTEGTCYALMVPDPLGQIRRLDILNPTRVQALRDESDDSIWYQVTMDDGSTRLLPGSQVICIKHMSANGIKGIRPIDVLRRSLDYDTQVKEMSLDQLDGINNGIMLTVPSVGLSQEQKEDAVDRFLETYQQSGKRVVILEGGMTATNFSGSQVDAQLLDVERITRNRVATVYNLPPHMLGDYTGTSYSTAEQQMMEFLQLTISPIVEQWEEELNSKLLTPEDYEAGYRFRFDITALTRTDVKTTAERNQMAIRGGWRTPNEVRQELYLPPDPLGNQLMSSRDLIPLRIAVETPEMLLGSQAAAAKRGDDDGSGAGNGDGTGGDSEGKEDET